MTTKSIWNLDTNLLHFHAPSFNTKGQRIVEVSLDPVTTQYKDRIAIQLCRDTDRCVAKWNLQKVKEGEDGSRRDLKLNVSDADVVDGLEKFDEFLIDTAFKNKKEWFPRKDYSREQIADKLKGVYREQDDGTKCVHIKIKCPGATSLTQIQVEGTENERKSGTIDDLVRGAYVIPIVRIFNVWFMEGGSFGVTLQTEKILVQPPPKITFLQHFHISRPLEWCEAFDEVKSEVASID